MRRGCTTTVRRRRWNPWYGSITHSLHRGKFKTTLSAGKAVTTVSWDINDDLLFGATVTPVPVRRRYNAFRKKFNVIGLACLRAANARWCKAVFCTCNYCLAAHQILMCSSQYRHIIATGSESAVAIYMPLL